MKLSMTRIDRDGVPCILQGLHYIDKNKARIRLFNGYIFTISLAVIREYCSYYPSKLNLDNDFEAVQFYIDTHHNKFFNSSKPVDPDIAYRQVLKDERYNGVY